MKENMIDLPDVDRRVYRVFSRRRLLELLETQDLALVHPSKWDDPFENWFLKVDAVTPNGETVSLRQLSEKWYGQCWTFHRDSDAMWRIYSPNKNGIRVASTVGKLFSAIYDSDDKAAALKYFAGAVTYRPVEEIKRIMRETSFWDVAVGGQNDGFARLLCLKRPEFAHEAEMRILVNDVDGSRGVDGLYKCKVEVPELIEEVAIDPRLRAEEVEATRNALSRARCPEPIIQSDLYQFQMEPIRIQ